MNKFGCFFFFFLCLGLSAQTKFSNRKKTTLHPTSDTLQFSKVSISPVNFQILKNQVPLSKDSYRVDFAKGVVYLNAKENREITIVYTSYPHFLTKPYTDMDENLIVPYRTQNSQLYSWKKKNNTAPLEGLYTQGSLSRGFQIGSNQDAVLNAALDLQISGKLSEKITLRAAISDSSIPIQKNGYSQNIEEFDRVYMELFSDLWSLKAGDIQLSNRESHFLKFDKKVSGISVDTRLSSKEEPTEISASGALVRGRFTRNTFPGIEGNQGPYKLQGPNGELFLIILSDSETVYVNGIPLKRGTQNDYTIDYNTAEITFTPTYPITANMRIRCEFQYSDRNYTRFVTYNKAKHTSEKLSIGGHFYLENDSKNQPLQLNLTSDQKKILEEAGNDPSKMVSSGGIEEKYNENKIQYTKTQTGVFEYAETENPNQTYYRVTFQFVGTNQGDYIFLESNPFGKIYQYLGKNQGDYRTQLQLVAPTKLQVAVADLKYTPSEKTSIAAEVAFSDADKNLFSNIEDSENKGLASKISWEQIYTDKTWLLKSAVNFDFLQDRFETVQRVYNIEFSRDWGIQNTSGDQALLHSSFTLSNKRNKHFHYSVERLNLGDHFHGKRQLFSTDLSIKNTAIKSQASILHSETDTEKTTFIKTHTEIKQHFNKIWTGALVASENYQTKNKTTGDAQPLNQKFISLDTYLGVGDSTKIFTKIGINLRTNDSVRNHNLTTVNRSKNYYLQATWIKNERSNLSLYANYREVNNLFFENQNNLNSRVNYQQQLFENFIHLNTLYETSSGVLPRQEFTYIKTEPGQGYYTWIDYNNNGQEEFNEFEIAKFSDEAAYLRVVLPSIQYTKINRTKFSQSLHIDFGMLSKKKKFLRFLSPFQNQSFVLIDLQKKRGKKSFHFNPFDLSNENNMGVQYNFRNSLFFNRGQQKYSTTYTHSNAQNRNNLGIGFVENKLRSDQVIFQHKIGFYWLIDLHGVLSSLQNTSENFEDRNYLIETKDLRSKLTFKHTKTTNFSLNYDHVVKNESLLGAHLTAHKLGTSFQFSHPKKGALVSDFNFYNYNFEGDANRASSYQMLDGLQPGNNYVWNVVFQKKLTKILYLNLNYSGRKSDQNIAIHTGNIQVRANF